MKKKIFFIFALLTVSAACFAGCTDKGNSKRVQAPENVTEIVAVDDGQEPAEENGGENEKDEKDCKKTPHGCPDEKCPDGKCPRESMPRPRHRFMRPRHTKD